VIVLLMVAASGAQAQEQVHETASSASVTAHDLFEARLRYGASLRTGVQDGSGPRVDYTGMTPNDLALGAWGWFLLDGHLGGFLSFQREGFALFDLKNDNARVTSGTLLRVSVGPAGRLWFGPVRLELNVGYSFAQLPTFGSAAMPVFAAGRRHGILLAARGLVDVGPLTIEAGGELPISLSAADGAGNAASSSGFVVGGAVRLQLFRTGTLMWGLLADARYGKDSLSTSGGLVASQSVVRVGGAIDLKWQEEVIARFGEVEVRVVDADSGAVLPGAVVEVGDRKIAADENGIARLAELTPGAVTTRGSAGGYLPAQGQATIEAGALASLMLKLKKEPPKFGALVIRVLNREAKTPMANATVKVGEGTETTNAKGEVSFEALKPGPIGILVTADGYNPGEEAASVVAGQTSDVTVAMVEVKKRIPATITGLVRSTSGGKPVTADLEIPQAKIKTKANGLGAFTFRLEGGTYTVNISAPGYLSQSKSVSVKDGDQAIFNVDLHPK
jgi:hypothetical protein